MISQRRWFKIHGWLGLPLWLFFSFVVITGSIAVISHELTWLFQPSARADNPKNLPRQPLSRLLAQTQASVDVNTQVSQVQVFEPYMAITVATTSPNKPRQLILINPYSGQIQAKQQGISFIGFIRSLHGWLLAPWHHRFSWGYLIVSSLSLLLIAMSISGIMVYKFFWRAFYRPMLRANKGTRVFIGDMHRFFGAWSLIFLFIMALSSLWYFTSLWLWQSESTLDVKPALLSTEQVQPERLMLSMTEAVKRAEQHFPDMKISLVKAPEHARDYYFIAGKTPGSLFDDYSQRLFIHPWSGELVEEQNPNNMSLLQSISHLADPFHYGTFAGLASKLLWFFFGLLLSFLSISGFWIWSNRTSQRAGS